MNFLKKPPSRALVPIDDVVAALPFIVRRDHRIVAAFARQANAIEWAELRSFNDENLIRPKLAWDHKSLAEPDKTA